MTFCMPEDQLWSAEGLADKRLADKGFACMLAKEACMRASLAELHCRPTPYGFSVTADLLPTDLSPVTFHLSHGAARGCDRSFLSG